MVSCPCALVISIPLTFFGGIGAASKRGVLVKGSNYLEALNNAVSYTHLRKVCHFPNVLEFLPADGTEKHTPIVLTVDEYETICLDVYKRQVDTWFEKILGT